MERTKAIESAELSKRTAEAELVRKKAAATKLELQLQEERRESEEERNRLVVEHERFVSFMCEFKVRTALAVSLGPPTTFAVSNFKRAYDEAGDVPITHATQVFGFLVPLYTPTAKSTASTPPPSESRQLALSRSCNVP